MNSRQPRLATSADVAADVAGNVTSGVDGTSIGDGFVDGVASTSVTSMVELVAFAGAVIGFKATATSVALATEDTLPRSGTDSGSRYVLDCFSLATELFRQELPDRRDARYVAQHAVADEPEIVAWPGG